MQEKHSFWDLIRALKEKRVLVILLLGFSSGLPIMLLYKSIKIWLRRDGIDLSTIGYISWVTVPYSFNFIWAFLFDRFTPMSFGRRRSWLLITQLGLVLALVLLSFANPQLSVPFIVVSATLLCFFSASQDVVVDAYRREILAENELGVGAAIGVYGYRVGMLAASGLGLWLVDQDTLGLSFGQMFLVMAGFMGVGLFATWWCAEPKTEAPPPATMVEAIVHPFLEFFKRKGAIVILLFILLFKIGDSMAGAMVGAFYVDVGFSNKQIAEITSVLGFFSTMAGLFVGGALIYRLSYYIPMLLFAVLQSLSTLSFVLLTQFATTPVLAGVVFFEDFSSGMGTAALVGFMSTMTNKRFTATQYALFASLASFGRTFFSGFSGKIIDWFTGVAPEQLSQMESAERSALYIAKGYPGFFVFCALIAIPGMILLFQVWKLQKEKTV